MIDEIQLLRDRERGWGWTNAFLGMLLASFTERYSELYTNLKELLTFSILVYFHISKIPNVLKQCNSQMIR